MANQTFSPLESHIGFWMRMVSNHVSGAFAAKLADEDVSVAEWVAMRELADLPPAAPSLLAERMGMTRGAITKIADRLIAKGLVVRAAGEGDRRYQTLALTSAARALLPRLAALADQNDAETFGDLSPAERQALMTLLQNIARRRGLAAPPID